MGEPARSRDVKPGRTEGSPLDKTEKPEVLNLVKEEVSSGVKEVDEYPPQGEVLNLVKEKVFSGTEEGVYRPPHGEESDVKTVFQVYPEPEFDSDTCSEYADSEHIKRELDSLEDEEASVANEDGDEEEEKPSILALEAAMKAYESRSMGNETSPTFTVKSEFMPSTTNLEENPDASRSHLIMSGETESAKRMRNLKSPLEQEKRMLSSSSSSQGCGQEVPLSTQSFVGDDKAFTDRNVQIANFFIANRCSGTSFSDTFPRKTSLNASEREEDSGSGNGQYGRRGDRGRDNVDEIFRPVMRPYESNDSGGKSFPHNGVLLSQSQLSRSSSDLKPFTCDECHKNFTRKSHLNIHKRIHTGFKPHTCDECGKSFTTKGILTVHRRNHFGIKPFGCDECGRSFSSSSHLTKHKRSHSGVKPFSCEECGKCFPAVSQLRVHRRSHSDLKPFECDECGKGFKSASHLSRHKASHLGIKPFTCDECGKSFTSSSHLTTHKGTHSDLKPFECDECGKGFMTNSHLMRHKSSHLGLKPFTCDECGNSFISNSNLIRHKRSHLGLKPYPCDECGKSFTSANHLTRHKRSHSDLVPLKVRINP